MADAVFRHIVEYPDNHDIPLSDIAATLIAQERLIPLAAEMLEQIYPGLKVQKTKINLEFARHGSLTESLFVAIFTVYQKDLDRDVPDFIEHVVGGKIPDEYRTIVTVLVLLLVYYGAKAVGKKIFRSNEGKAAVEPPSATVINYGTMLNFASGQTGADRRVIEDALEHVAGTKQKGSVARAAIDMMRPAKRGHPGRIVSPGVPDIPPEVVAEFPDTALVELDEGTEVETFNNAILEVRATDRDKDSRGWAGKLHSGSMSTKRLKIQLSPAIDREALGTKLQARVDALVESKRLGDDTLKPVRIHVTKLIS